MNSMSSQSERTELLELYKRHAELADRVSQREGANRLFVSILTGFFALVVVVARFGLDGRLELSWLLGLGGLLGLGLCVSWYIIIRAYRQLNTGKFAALYELESQLSYAFFKREWELLGTAKSFNKYWQLTVAETMLPIIFGIAYLVVAVWGLYCAN